MAVHFFTELNGVITDRHHGDINHDFFGTPYFGHNRIEIPSDAVIIPLDRLDFYDRETWERKSDLQLIDEGLLPMPKGWIRDGRELREMTPEERVIAGLDMPRQGFKIEDGKVVQMAPAEMIAAGLLTQEEYNSRLEEENKAELQRRLTELQTPDVTAMAEIDEDYAAWRRGQLKALLGVKSQAGWPLDVVWP